MQRRPLALPPFLSDSELADVTISCRDSVDPVRLRHIMHEHGFAIVTDVLSAQECSELTASFTRDIAAVATVDSSDLAVILRGRAIPGHFQRSFCSHLGLMHSELSWRCRLHPNVRSIYSALYQSDELVTGLDNLFFTQDSVEAETENSFWPHADQSVYTPESGSWDVYQGIVYVWSSEPSSCPDSSTTVLLPKSHRDLYNELMAATDSRTRSHYCEIAHLTDQNTAAHLEELFRQGCKRMPMPEGSLLLWNSKTLHQGWTSGRRLAQPVCWEPKTRRHRSALVRKAAMTIRGLPSTHWASLGILHDCCGKSLWGLTCANGAASLTTSAQQEFRSGWRWLRSWAVRDGVVMSNQHLESLLEAATLDGDSEESQELFGALKDEVAAAL